MPNPVELQAIPGSDQPADTQGPVIQRMVHTARRVNPPKSHLILAVVLSYIISIGVGAGIAFLMNSLYGTPSDPGYYSSSAQNWQLGVGLALFSAFLLGLTMPILLARGRKLQAVAITLALQSLTLVFLVLIGLSRINELQEMTQGKQFIRPQFEQIIPAAQYQRTYVDQPR